MSHSRRRVSCNPVKSLLRVVIVVVLIRGDTLFIVKPAALVTTFNGVVDDVVVGADGTPVTGVRCL